MRGSGATGSNMNATAPHSATPTVNKVVATGLRMNGAEMFTSGCPQEWRRRHRAKCGRETARRSDRTTDKLRAW